MSDEEFVPANELENTLLLAQQGQGSTPDFLNSFVNSQVFVLLDKDLGPEGQWDPSINLCVLTNAAGGPVVAVFTAPERAIPWSERLPQFQHGLLVSPTWLMQGLGPTVGIVVNPGHKVGVELSPDAIQQMKDAIAAATTIN
ncbi:MAG: SseB family protein [Pseudoxanthomonas sp.]|nr:SseB family protein [Pseudoxanthomonas sp.]